MEMLLLALTMCALVQADNTGETLNTTVCMFEDTHTCGWTNDLNEATRSYNWQVVNNRFRYAVPRDHTYGVYYGHYMSMDPNQVDTSVTPKIARLTSPVFNPGKKYCIQLYYTLSGNDALPIKVYAKEYGGLGYPVLTLQPRTNDKWTYAQVELDSEYTSAHFQVVIEGQMPSYKSYHFGSYNYYKMDQKIGVDDIYVSNTGCGNVPRCPLATYTANFGDERVCLYFNTTATTWSKAVKSCRQMSPFGHLVSVENEEKQKLIVNFINNQGDFNIAAQHGGVWTSGADLDTEGSWRWTNTDRGVNYTDWKPGQPNNVGDRQNCLVLDYPEDNYTWGDEYCDLEKPFICQMSYDRSVVDRPQ